MPTRANPNPERAPGRPRPRTKPPDQRRDDLLNAAQHVFLTRGVAEATIEEITVRAEVAKGTFYLYFASKEALLSALGDRFAQQLLARITTGIAAVPADDWPGKLTAWANAGVDSYVQSIRLHDIAFHAAHASQRQRFVDNRVIDHLDQLLRAGQNAGAWTLDDARFTAVFLFSALHGVIDDAYAHHKRLPRAQATQIAHKLERLCLRAVGWSA